MRHIQSYTSLRTYTEKFTWIDPRTGARVTGFKHPQTAIDVQRKTFYIKAVTKSGHVLEGNCVTISVNTDKHQRKVRFVDSNEIRVVNDVLVIEVDGVRFITH